jgi:hypothetical protein
MCSAFGTFNGAAVAFEKTVVKCLSSEARGSDFGNYGVRLVRCQDLHGFQPPRSVTRNDGTGVAWPEFHARGERKVICVEFLRPRRVGEIASRVGPPPGASEDFFSNCRPGEENYQGRWVARSGECAGGRMDFIQGKETENPVTPQEAE